LRLEAFEILRKRSMHHPPHYHPHPPLIAAALVGIDRHAFTLPPTRDRLDALLSQLDPGDRQRQFLSAAAAIALYHQAGRIPQIPDIEEISPALPESAAAICGEFQHESFLMQRLLSSDFLEVLPEWCAALVAAGKRVPPESLPQWLELGRKHPQLQPTIATILGHRGRWLAAQNPDWDYAVPLDFSSEEANETWRTGTVALRSRVLHYWRDRFPEKARELLELTWLQDKAPDRAVFLATFGQGLSLADEPLLEAALDDKSKLVRAAAANLLACLSGSQLVGRTIDRISAYVRVQSNALAIALPPRLAEDAIRDGINPQPPSGIGEKAWWLLQFTSIVPPTWWTDRMQLAPAVLIEAACQSEWSVALLEGWAIAAVRHGDRTWAAFLIPHLPSLSGYMTNITETGLALMKIVPIAHKEASIFALLESSAETRFGKNHPLLSLLGLCRHPWSLELSRKVLDRVAIEIAASKDNYNWGVRSTVKAFAYYLHLDAIDAAIQQLSQVAKPGSYWAQTVEDIVAIVELRRDLLRC
jgi:Family of unknown function (DUF5691)